MPGPDINPDQFRRTLRRSLLLPVGSAALVAVVLLAQVIYLLSLQYWVEYTDRTIEQAYALEKLLVDQESGLRGFLLTANPEFFAPFERAAPEIEPALDELERYVADSASQMAQLRLTRDHHTAWQSFASEMLELHRQRGDVPAQLRLGQGKRHMDAMRSQIDAIISEEKQVRERRVRASARAAWIVLTSTGGLILLLGVVLAVNTRRHLVALASSYNRSITTIENRSAALRESEDRYRALVELSPDGIAVHEEGRILYANTAFASMLGFDSPADLIGRGIMEFIHPEYHQQVRDRMQRLAEGAARVPLEERRLVRRDGSEVWIEAAAGALTYEGRHAVQAVVRDITARKRIENALRRSEASLARAQQIARLGSWELELASDRIEWSDEMYRIVGVGREFEPTRASVWPFIAAEDQSRIDALLQWSVETGQAFDVDLRLIRPDGVERLINAQGEVVRDQTGQPVKLIGTVLDITERKRAEEALVQLNETLEQRVHQRTAELRAALDDLRAFSYTISHDLRAPLRGLQTLTQALLSEHGDALDAAGEEYCRRIVAAAARMDRLTQEILEYSRLSHRELSPQRVSVVLVLHEVIGQLQRDPHFAAAQISMQEPMPWVLAHRATLSTIFSNLLSNAAKFVPPQRTPVIHIWAERRNGQARVWVQDNGEGIAPENQERIFDVFERLHASDEDAGAGLGLAIVRRGVERMGGRVGVESQLGRGSRFWIELPLDPQSP